MKKLLFLAVSLMAAGSLHAMKFAPPRDQYAGESDVAYKAYRDDYNAMVSSALSTTYGGIKK